jgi:hypothetical protein
MTRNGKIMSGYRHLARPPRRLSWVEIGEWALGLAVTGAIGFAFGWSVVGGDGVGLLRLVIL